MIWQDEKGIHIHKGNSGGFTIPLTFENAAYTMNGNDVLKVSVRAYPEPSDLFPELITKENTGSNVFAFTPEDTAELECGVYYLDAKLFLSTGDETTVIIPTQFHVERIVTNGKGVPA